MKGKEFVVRGGSVTVVYGEGFELVWDYVQPEDYGERTDEVCG